MIDLNISDKEIIYANENFAIIIFDSMNYELLEKRIVECSKDVPEENLKKGDTREVWKSIPCYTSSINIAIKNLFEYSIKKNSEISKDFKETVTQLETLYNKIEKNFNFYNTIEYKKYQSEQDNANRKL